MTRIFAALAGAALAMIPAAGFAQAPSPSPLDIALALEEAFVSVADQAAPGVVTVRVEGAHVRGADVPEDPDELREWLRREKPRLDPFMGMGSGFVVDAAGTIFTNAHVVAGAQSIEVVFSDGRTGKADVVGVDKGSDVAVIRLIDPSDDLTVLPVGDSETVRVGQFALAIGSPLKLEGSFTVGHVSALHRNNVGESLPGVRSGGFEDLHYQDFLQVDTPINPGNSGGPLLDIHGRVIGINTAIYDAGGGGIGFSIPINMALRIGEQLTSTGRVRRGWLGIKMNPLDPDLAEIYGLGEGSRVIIIGVEAGSPAEKGRFQEQDIVLEFGGELIRSVNDLTNAIANSPIGEEVGAVVYRPDVSDDGRVELTVVLTERPQAEEPESQVSPTASRTTDGSSIVWVSPSKQRHAGAARARSSAGCAGAPGPPRRGSRRATSSLRWKTPP